MPPLVSIIVPNYNHAPYLRERLDSIFSQTFLDFEVILLDDNSSDSSKQVLKEYAKHPKVSHFIVNEKNSGSPFKQWERGVNLAKGEYIWIAESDDSCEITFLEGLIRHLEQKDVALVYCQSKKIDSKGKIFGNWIEQTATYKPNPFTQDFKMAGNKFIEKFLIHKNVIPNVSAVLFRKEHLIKILPLDQSPCFRFNADWYYYIQVLSNANIVFVADSLNNFRVHFESVIGQAASKEGFLKIYKFELEGGKKMMRHLEKCRLDNLSEIRTQHKLKMARLYLLIARTHLFKSK